MKNGVRNDKRKNINNKAPISKLYLELSLYLKKRGSIVFPPVPRPQFPGNKTRLTQLEL